MKEIRNVSNISSISLEEWIELREEMTTYQWIDFILTSLGYNPDSLTIYEKVFYMVRLIPFCVGNYNLIELGEPGTGKSTLYENYYRHSTTKKGSITEPALFGDLSTKKDGRPGLINTHDIVAFDEVAEMKMDKNLPSVLLGYMASGIADREGNQTTSNASLIFLGNLKDTQVKIYENDSSDNVNLFENFPKEINVDAFKDRIHYFIPGWQIRSDKASFHENVGYGISVKSFFEILKKLRSVSFKKEIQDHIDFESIESRDKDALDLTLQGLLKILHPHRDINSKEMNFYIDIARLGREIVSKQKDINKFNFYSVYNKDTYNNWILNSFQKILREHNINKIEEAYADNSRFLIKPFGKNCFYKVALNRLGVNLNMREYKLYNSFKDKNLEYIESICGVEKIDKDFLVIKQEYCRPNNNTNEIIDININLKDDIFDISFLEDKKILKILKPSFDKFESTIVEKNNEIYSLHEKINGLSKEVQDLKSILQEYLRLMKIDQMNLKYWLNNSLGHGKETIEEKAGFLVFNEEKNGISEILELISKNYDINPDNLFPSDYGISNGVLKIINFAHFINQ